VSVALNASRILVAALLSQPGDWCIEVLDERHEIDDRLGRHAGHGGRADVVHLRLGQQSQEPIALGCETRRPGGVVLDDLDRRVWAARVGEIASGRGAEGGPTLRRVSIAAGSQMRPSQCASRSRRQIGAQPSLTKAV
jgi:hypothetical protein